MTKSVILMYKHISPLEAFQAHLVHHLKQNVKLKKIGYWLKTDVTKLN